ncbi:hypothetical protein ACFYWU_34100 [Streptomyces chrestomyceticus]|uniref:hypothetical protein n=1 Tax=Streptomyces chrestomyceticus TaxID=68185 RepID=UPI0036B6ABA7
MSFADDLDAVRRAAVEDASLVAALESDGKYLTQVLAAGPVLARHYEQSAGECGIYGSALMAVAMDAHRSGLPFLPLTFLKAAAPVYPTGKQRSQASLDWFTGALDYARTLTKDTTRPLQEVPRPSGPGPCPVCCVWPTPSAARPPDAMVALPSGFLLETASVHLTSGAHLARLADRAWPSNFFGEEEPPARIRDSASTIRASDDRCEPELRRFTHLQAELFRCRAPRRGELPACSGQ